MARDTFAGLKGEDFLIMQSWNFLEIHPELTLKGRTTKLADIYAHVAVHIEGGQKVPEQRTKALGESFILLKGLLKDALHYERIEGVHKIESDYSMRQLDLQIHLLRLTIDEGLLKNQIMPHFMMPMGLDEEGVSS
jgi:hypothetical protein